MSINCNYTLNHPSGYEYNLKVYNAVFEKDCLLVNVSSDQGGKHIGAAIYTARDDAIDLAWSILEHYGVTERPPAPLVVGDFVELTDDLFSGESNPLGKIVSVAPHTGHFSIRGIDGEFLGWRGSDELGRLTKEEFLAEVSARTAKFVGEG